MDPVHSLVDHGRLRSMVDCGQGLGDGSPKGGQNGTPVRGTLPRLRKKGEGTSVIITSCRRGQKRSGISGQETAEEALGVSGAWAWREEKRGGERYGGGR
jgi:hypothetical protein